MSTAATTLPLAALLDTIAGLIAQVPGVQYARVSIGYTPEAYASLAALPGARLGVQPATRPGMLLEHATLRLYGVELVAARERPMTPAEFQAATGGAS